MNRLFLLAMLSLALCSAGAAEPNAPVTASTVVEIRLDADPAVGLVVGQDKKVRYGAAQVSKFKMIPGLKSPDFVSFEMVGRAGSFLRHHKFVLYLHEQPAKEDLLFEADTSFKVIHLAGDKVRLEASNFRGMFMTARDDGSMVIERDPPLEPSTFFLKRVAE